MISRPDVWNHLFGHQGRLALDKGFASALREAGHLYQGNVEAVAREYLRFVYLDWVMPAGAFPSEAAQATAAAAGGIPGLPTKASHDEGQASTYEGTLAAYRREFGEPPAWFWPTPGANVPGTNWAWLSWGRAFGGLVMLAGIAGVAFGETMNASGSFTLDGYVIWMTLSTITASIGGLCMLLGGPAQAREGSGSFAGSGSSDYGVVAANVAICASATASSASCSFSDGGSSAGC